ncbi:MAG TPA: GNAT family N-acetyltransferase [Flavobacteriales bacterium]|nr:GNAT family N-acetyltransferase [Flavobacteriales bacterium]
MIVASTHRLIIRDLDDRDAPNIFLLNSDPEVLKYVHDVPFKDVDAAREWIANIGEQLPLGIGRWAIESKDGTWIGRCSLRRYADGEVLMGYRLLRTHWGKGYASEAAGAMLNHAFNTHGLKTVLSKVAKDNKASQRVMEKNGGVFWMEGSAENFAEALVYRFALEEHTGPIR